MVLQGIRDPFEEVSVGDGIPDGMIIPTSVTTITEKKTRNRSKKCVINLIEVDGVVKEVLELSKEELAQWFNERLPIYYEDIHNMVLSKKTSDPIKVKLYELITKITGQVTEKHEITVVNPEEIARRGIEAAKELESFKVNLIEGNTTGS